MPLGDSGEADGLPRIDEITIDKELKHRDWPNEIVTRRLGKHILDADNSSLEAVASYGFRVYKDLLDEGPVDAVYLDPRCFLPETDLIDVLEQAVKCAQDDDHEELLTPIIKGMIDTAQIANFAGDRMQKYLPTVLNTGNASAIRVYVEFMNAHTVKNADASKDFLKHMAHSVASLPVDGDRPGSVNWLDKQILLEDIGHAWIRKSMPVSEIDWLP